MQNSEMNVLHTIYHGTVGGGETHLLNLIEHLNEAEFKSVVITFSEGLLSEKLKSLGIKCYVVPAHSRLDLSVWRQVCKIARAENIHLINAHGTKACLNSFWTSRRLNIPLVYRIQNWAFHPHRKWLKRSLGVVMERLLVRQANLNISVSLNNDKIGRELLSIPNSVIIPNGVDTIKFNHRTKGSINRRDLQIPRNRTLYGFIARFCDQKDPLTLVKGFKQALNADRNLHLLMVGEGELKKECLDTIKDLKIESHVTYIPFVENVEEILSMLDVYCLPSKWEDLPIGILEAMAMKKVVIATPVDGIVEIIANEVNGLLVPTGCENSWKEAILRLHTHPELRKEFSDRARLIVEAHHDIQSSALKVAQMYRKLNQNHHNRKTSILGEVSYP